jgi:hypothetical protein|nr:MAG TPA: Protein of unknown function (DUF2514) [Caudoviricetes sp.]
MGVWLKVGGALIAAVVLFVSGYKYASALYEADIADMQAKHALALKDKTDEYRAKEQSQAKQLADAWDKYEKARAESVDLRADVDRVRIEADRYRAELSRASSDSCTPVRKRLARCAELLAEGASLSSEGASLSQRIAGKHDAVVKIHNVN